MITFPKRGYTYSAILQLSPQDLASYGPDNSIMVLEPDPLESESGELDSNLHWCDTYVSRG